MTYRTLLILAAAGLITTPALAQQSRTTEFDNARFEGTRTVERADGTLTRDTDVTRKSDGATASSDFTRQRSEDGVSRDRIATDFQGRTATSTYDRERTPNGWSAEGQRVQRDGDVIDYTSRGVRGPNRVAVRQTRSVNGEPTGVRRSVRRR
ncbi:MAG: hypothetical protein B7Z08_09355 [Sphingomonadales bacterium 32-68-7]|nr:MAG: hypothetical protein B7Z33_11990 [Sphingomonadales bacterium 12-68-11]OYX08498.1 MAG: hypothetical protein B7Z08_09355 [Sphingomonadales bacterium 32-68-7]